MHLDNLQNSVFRTFFLQWIEILRWNLVHSFILISYRASLTLVTVDLFLQESCTFITYKIQFSGHFSAMDRDIQMKGIESRTVYFGLNYREKCTFINFIRIGFFLRKTIETLIWSAIFVVTGCPSVWNTAWNLSWFLIFRLFSLRFRKLSRNSPLLDPSPINFIV